MIPLLIIDNGDGDAPNFRDTLDHDVQVWREAEGAAFAYCATVDRLHWIDMPGIARFRFHPGGGDVNAVPHPGAGPERVRDAYHRTALPMILQARRTEVLHASAILTNAGVVAFCGESGTGKSTIAVGFGRRGYGVWADDAVAFDMSAASPLAIPLPFRVRLRPRAAAFFAQSSSAASVAAPHPEPLAAVCVLERVSELEGGAVVERLPSLSAFCALLPHAFCFSLQDPRCKRRMTEHYLQLVERVPCLGIRFRPGLEGLAAILDVIQEGVVGSRVEPSRAAQFALIFALGGNCHAMGLR